MSFNTVKIENLIKEYLLEEGILREKLPKENFDFGFVFSYPPGGPQSQNMSIYKLKNKNTISITIRYQISEEQYYPQKDKDILKNSIFKRIHKVFFCYIYSNLIIEDYCMGKEKKGDKYDFSIFSWIWNLPFFILFLL